MEKNGYENYSTEPCGNQKASGDGNSVKKRVNAEAEENGTPGMPVFEFFVVGFFAKMEMWRDGVFEKMNEKETDQNVEKGTLPGEADGFRKNFNKDDGKHVAGAEREEILQILARPLFAHDEIAAEEVAGGGHQAEDARKDRAQDFCAAHLWNKECQVSGSKNRVGELYGFRRRLSVLQAREQSRAI